MAFYTPRNISPADQILFDANGNAVGIQAAGSSSQPVLGMTPAKAAAVDFLVSGERNTLPALIVGGDHPYAQWVGGMGPAYRDAGLTPFCAVCTDTSLGGTTAPTGTGEMASWGQVSSLPSMGVEVVSHGARHIQSWSRINTGIRVRYIGVAASPTVAISNTALTLTGNGGAENAALAFATYGTLAALVAQINAQGGGVWIAALADELTGAEQSGNLLTVGARNVASSTNNQYFAAGGGIVLRYIGRAYEQVYASRNNSSRLEIFCDGVRRVTLDLTSGSYDTLAEVVAGVNAAGISGLTAALSDNRKTETSSFLSYVVGDESSLNLKIQQCEIQTRRTSLDAGLPRWYMIERQMARSRDVAAANGVTMRHFAQPGDDFHQYLTDHTGYESFRGNSDVRFISPLQSLLGVGDGRFALMQTTADNSAVGWNAARYRACIDALCDSPGFLVSLNTHKVVPDGSSGGRYSFPNGDAYGELIEADFLTGTQYAGSKVRAGALVNLTPTQMHRARASAVVPKSLVFNPKFRNDGTTLLNVTDAGFKVPGWYLVTPNSIFSAVSVANDALVCTTTASTGTIFAQQEVLLQPGRTYLLSVLIEFTSYSSGNGVVLALQAPRGRVPSLVAAGSNATYLGQRNVSGAGNGTRMQRAELVVTIPQTAAVALPKVVGNAGPYNLGAGAQIKLNIDTKLQLEFSVAGATPSATTVDEVVTAINAAIAASASYPAEYRGAARNVDGKVVIVGPYASIEERNDSGYGIQIDNGTTNTATATVFGNTSCRAPGFYQQPTDATQWPWLLTLQSAVIGSYAISAPTVIELAGA